MRQEPFAALRAELAANVIADQGGEHRVSTVKMQNIEQWAGACILVEAQLFKGLRSTKERSRQRALDSYQGLLDRFMRLSSRVGLEREAKQVPDLHTYLAERERT